MTRLGGFGTARRPFPTEPLSSPCLAMADFWYGQSQARLLFNPIPFGRLGGARRRFLGVGFAWRLTARPKFVRRGA